MRESQALLCPIPVRQISQCTLFFISCASKRPIKRITSRHTSSPKPKSSLLHKIRRNAGAQLAFLNVQAPLLTPPPASFYVDPLVHLFSPRSPSPLLEPLQSRIPPLPVCRPHVLRCEQPSPHRATITSDPAHQSPHSPESRLAFWNATAGNALRTLLEWTSYPQHLQMKYDSFLTTFVIPRLGPSPHMIDPSRLQSQLQDDHTPLEFSCVLESDACGKVQCYAEPLNPMDGSSTPRETWMANIQNMLVAAGVRDADLSWCRMCADTLTIDPPSVLPDSGIHIQFAMGTLTKNSFRSHIQRLTILQVVILIGLAFWGKATSGRNCEAASRESQPPTSFPTASSGWDWPNNGG